MSILEVNQVKKVYTTRFGSNKVMALKNVNFSIEQGEYTAIMGESGAGKTTLLNILAALDRPSSGSVILDGKDITRVRKGKYQNSDVITLDLYFRILTCLTHFRWKIIYIFPLYLQESLTGK